VDYEEKRAKLKPIEWDNPNKMHIETGHKTFDRQTVCLSCGNCWAPTQHSSYVRAWNDTVNPVGQKVTPGHLQNYDLRYFWDIRTPKYVIDKVKEHSHDKEVIFYALFHWTNDGHRIIDGYILTDKDYKLIQAWTTGPTWKSSLVVYGAMPYLAWREDGSNN